MNKALVTRQWRRVHTYMFESVSVYSWVGGNCGKDCGEMNISVNKVILAWNACAQGQSVKISTICLTAHSTPATLIAMLGFPFTL